MKNILFLEQFNAISGGQKVLFSILDGLDRRKYHPYVVIPEKGELSVELERMKNEYFVLPIGNYSAGRKNLFDIMFYLLRLFLLLPLTFRIIKQKKIDLVYANAPRTYVWSTIAAKAAGIPVIWHLHSLLSGWELRFCLPFYQVWVTKLVAVSRFVAKPFAQEAPKSADKIEVVYNGVDPSKYSAGQRGEEVRREFAIAADYQVVGYIGQIAEWKGVADLVRAASIVLKNDPKVVFLVVGEALFGGKKKGIFKRQLEEMANEYGIKDRLIFTGKRENIPAILSAIDILVIPSIEPDPCPLVLLEAMAAGKAIIVSAHGGPAEIIQDGKDGVLFPPSDYERLALEISRLLRDPYLVKSLGVQARLKAKQSFSLTHYQQQINTKIGCALND